MDMTLDAFLDIDAIFSESITHQARMETSLVLAPSSRHEAVEPPQAEAVAQAAEPDKYIIMLSVKTSESPARIRLQWQGGSAPMNRYEVYRKRKNTTSWGKVSATLSGSATFYVDRNVAVGQAYEYRVVGTKPGMMSSILGYIYAGIKVPAVESRGKVVLLVEAEQAAALKTELETLENDLIGDGWAVLRHDVSRNATPESVRSLVQADYNADSTNVKAVFLLGHIPVFKSGSSASPDGHADHKGPWPADVYYGTMTASWDNSPTIIPGEVQLQVGRVDFDNMPTFQKDATELLRQYLNKNHQYRIGQMVTTRDAFVSDGFGRGKLDNAAVYNGYRLFSTLWGNSARIDEGAWAQHLSHNTYTWGHINGGGNYVSVSAVGGSMSTSHLASQNHGIIFNQVFGSYLWNWDTQNNFMRAFLATPDHGLTSAWTGRPHWFFHHMALGETIGYSTQLTQNNKWIYTPAGQIGAIRVHIALMGDPTLRMFPVLPATNLRARRVSRGTVLEWIASGDRAVSKYHVYGATSPNRPYKRLGTTKGTRWMHFNPGNTKYYMVRASKLTETGSGSFYNLSQGVVTRIYPGSTPRGR